MKAIVQDQYGSPNVLQLKEIDKPVIKDNEVLVRVHAASMHPDVWHVMRGKPYALRIMGSGLLKPRNPVPGTDVAGIVEAVGGDVTRFRPGEEVLGEIVHGHQWKNGGAFAEYASALEESLALKPADATFEQAAAVPTSGLIAYENIRGRVDPGQRVLVNGAGGGVGIFATQLAKGYGAEVTAVDTSDKLDMLRSIGADHVVDYTRDDFTDGTEPYDLIFDIPGNRSFEDLKRVLAPDAKYIFIGHESYTGSGGRWIGSGMGRFIKMAIRSPFGSQPQGPPRPEETEDPIVVLAGFLEDGTITPVIDRTFPLSDVPEALRYLEGGRAQGKVVITI